MSNSGYLPDLPLAYIFSHKKILYEHLSLISLETTVLNTQEKLKKGHGKIRGKTRCANSGNKRSPAFNTAVPSNRLIS